MQYGYRKYSIEHSTSERERHVITGEYLMQRHVSIKGERERQRIQREREREREREHELQHTYVYIGPYIRIQSRQND